MDVLATCKFGGDPIQIEGTIDHTRSNMGFFLALKGKKLVNEKSDLAEIRIHPRIYGCPGCLQV